MKFDVVCLFPEIVDYSLSFSIIGKARKKGLIEIGFVNPRDYTVDRHKTIDEKPYGGGCGMVLIAEFVWRAIESVRKGNSYVVLLTPKGRVFNQTIAKEFSKLKHIILVCGHYEGIDERINKYVDDEISIGDYVLTGGELAAACIIDSVSRLVKGVIKDSSLDEESFCNFLLEYPHYTKPRIWKGIKVPDILLSGNHKEIAKWRYEKSLEITKNRRPDLYEKYMRRNNEQNAQNK
ncbi:MAG: tRNA (guanosine(37)-N1)-methyltransferase TrmD [Elusimicrobiales bacterium]|nr:tRNA (guanosine(37)-N1)-methyltransferase TrmD [Elusimicrobiales bacterium]